MVPFGSFETLCANVPSYPICNLFFRQVHIHHLSIFRSVSYPLTYLANPNLIGEYVRNKLRSLLRMIVDQSDQSFRLSWPTTPPLT